MTRRTRFVTGILFVLFLMVCGLALGTWIGGRFFVPFGSGLAGPAIALGYGVLGAGVAGIVGAVLAYVLAPRWLLFAAVPVVIAGGVLTVIIATVYLKAEAESQAHLEQAYENMNRFTLTLDHVEGSGASPFARMEVDWGERRYTSVSAGDDPRTCAAKLSGREAVALLGALREADGVVYKTPEPCAGTPGPVQREIEWLIREHMPPDSAGRVAITAACAARYPALEKPFEAAKSVFDSGDHPRQCD